MKAVIFDMDGLMIDSERVTYEGYVQLCKEHGVDLEIPVYVQCLGKPVPAIWQVFYDHFGEDFPIPQIMQGTHQLMARRFETEGVPVKEGLQDLLEELKAKGYKTCVATSSTRNRVDRILELAGLEDYFDGVICGDEVEHGKPAPDIFLQAAAKIGVNPEDCLVLEDSEMGIEAAARGGIPVICIPDMKEPDPEYAAKTAALLPSLREVSSWLAQNS